MRITQPVVVALAVLLSACTVTVLPDDPTPPPIAVTRIAATAPATQATASAEDTADEGAPSENVAVAAVPTANPVRLNTPDLSALGDNWYPLWYEVAPGEDLGILSAQFGLSYEQLRLANDLQSGEVVQPGQRIIVPQNTELTSPPDKLLPDSELVYGPATVGFSTEAVVARHGGYLSGYSEAVGGTTLTGSEIVDSIAADYSVNPRLLLSLLEYHSGWLLSREVPRQTNYPMRYGRGDAGLRAQLTWAAATLNDAFYRWQRGELSLVILEDGSRVALDPTLNAGTVAVQVLLAQTHTADGWRDALANGDFSRTYNILFGNPFSFAVEPLLPAELEQPQMVLPWSGGETWYYVGGPHPSFGTGTPWGGIDFAPPDDNVGCYVSQHQITAVAAGTVARTGFGQVVIDLDGDGHEQTGWVVVYLHVDNVTKIGAGFEVAQGGYVGRPSCDGGHAEGTHLHIARKYNGVWLAADGSDFGIPFTLGGWQPQRGMFAYEGALAHPVYGIRTACDCRVTATNGVQRQD